MKKEKNMADEVDGDVVAVAQQEFAQAMQGVNVVKDDEPKEEAASEAPVKQKVADLDVDEDDKALLTFLVKPKTLMDIAFKFQMSKMWAYNKIEYFMIPKWVVPVARMGKKRRYMLNPKLGV